MADKAGKAVVAVFDFDGTITYVDSLLPFIRRVSGFIGFWVGLVCLSPVLVLHKAGVIGNSRTKEIFLTWFLRGRSEDGLVELGKGFAGDGLPALVNPLAVEKVEWHRSQGHRLLLLSASPELYLNAWGERNGFERVLATRLENNDGMLTGRIRGHNCHGAEKVERLKAELGEFSQYEIHSYGDSRSDLVLLDQVDHAGYRSFEGTSRIRYKAEALSRFLRALL